MLLGSPRRRSPAPPKLDYPPPRAGSELCAEGGCVGPVEIRCRYVGRAGGVCGIASCAEHRVLLDGAPFGPRHAEVLTAVARGAVEGGPLPDTFEGAPSLVTWISRGLNGEVSALLAGLTGADGDADGRAVLRSHGLRGGPAPALRRWETSWSVTDGSGATLSVSLEMGAGSDPDVIARIGPREVARQSPPWIARPLHDEEVAPELDARQRRDFYRHLHNCLAAGAERAAGNSRPALVPALG